MKRRKHGRDFFREPSPLADNRVRFRMTGVREREDFRIAAEQGGDFFFTSIDALIDFFQGSGEFTLRR